MTRTLLIWTLSTGLAYGADCPERTYSTDLSESIREAEATFSDLDIAAFKTATSRLAEIVPCLADPLTGAVAADVHRFMGVRAFADRDTILAKQMFAAARGIEPSYVFPESLIPVGNPIRKAYTAIDLGSGNYVLSPYPEEGYLQFDGRTTQQRPGSWPTVFQRFDNSGRIVDTAYLLPEDALPTFVIREGDGSLVLPPDASLEDPEPPKALLIATVASGLAAGTLYGAAGVTKARFNNRNTADERLEGLAGTANSLVIASSVAGAATVGLGIGVAIRW